MVLDVTICFVCFFFYNKMTILHEEETQSWKRSTVFLNLVEPPLSVLLNINGSPRNHRSVLLGLHVIIQVILMWAELQDGSTSTEMVIPLVLFFEFIELLSLYLVHLSTKQDVLCSMSTCGLEQSHTPWMHALIGQFLVKPHLSSVNGRVVVAVVPGAVFAGFGRAEEARKGVVGSAGGLAGAAVTVLLTTVMGYQEEDETGYQ